MSQLSRVSLAGDYREPNNRQVRGGLFPSYELTTDYDYRFRHLETEVVCRIPKGFRYSATFGSFLFWRKDIHRSAHTLFHDWGYQERGKIVLTCGIVAELTKEDHDNLFLEGIRRDTNVQNWRAAIASGAFKTLGHIVWRT